MYPHNKRAYEKAVRMLEESGKAAIVHPTGTGKSFIGFCLAWEHEKENVCWLSPSEYIYETQLENLKKATGGEAPANIAFFTYAKLMQLSEEELRDIKADYIVLDEFHRCGAAERGWRDCSRICLKRNCWGFPQRACVISTTGGICPTNCLRGTSRAK